MRRRIVNWGIFSRRTCSGCLVQLPADLKIYQSLKDLGFQETPWQIIFDGQLGGLVFPYNDGLNEIHIRFYNDRIFSELEFSRCSIFHFLFPLYNANEYIATILKEKLSDESYRLLLERMNTNLREEEIARPKWNYLSSPNPYAVLKRRSGRFASHFLNWLFGWRALVGFGGFGFPILIPAQGGMYIGLFALVIAFISLKHIPALGKP
jgi:hypothetical protein